MAKWASGYVSDVEYLAGFYREQTPSHLDLACLINAVEPPSVGADWTLCDMGCGQGINCLLLAAANPRAQIIGVDFNPAQIARARNLASHMGLQNVQFIEAAFEDLALSPESLPECDYITMHGIYSWISAEGRAALVSILRSRLKAGGLAYVSYNALPGWNTAEPMQRLLLEHARHSPRHSTDSIRDGIGFINQCQDLLRPGLIEKQLIERIRGEADKNNVAYLAHEYLNQFWSPRYHCDVAAELEPAKLSFIGDATILANFEQLQFFPDQLKLLESVREWDFVETFKDYLTSRAFRRDIFMRGPRRLAPEERDRRLQEIVLSLTVAAPRVPREIQVAVGKAILEAAVYEPILETLSQGPVSIGALRALPAVASSGSGLPVEIAGLLTGTGRVLAHDPCRAGGDVDAACRYNAVILNDRQPSGQNSVWPVACPSTGNGIHLELFAAKALCEFLIGVPSNEGDLVARVWARMEKSGERLRREGVEIADAEENRAILAEQMAIVMRDDVPVWRQLGLVPLHTETID
jgi:SAM-dependent methyltransferase